MVHQRTGRGPSGVKNEDARLYKIRQGGIQIGNLFLNQALGAAYTPLSLGPDGRIYTGNGGILFSVGN